MKWIIVPVLWLAALALTVLVLWRLWRGIPVVLRGTWSPRLIRMVAVLLVILGVGVERASPAPAPVKPEPGKPADPAPDPMPALSPATLDTWVLLTGWNGPWVRFKQTFTQAHLGMAKNQAVLLKQARQGAQSAPPKLRAVLLADLDALEQTKQPQAVTSAELLAALDEAERGGYFDLWLTAYVWRVAGRDEGDSAARVELFARLARHARMTNALIKARARAQPALLSPRAWMSKAGPRPGEMARHQEALKDVLKGAKAFYARADLGTWQRDGQVALTVGRDGAPATLIRGGKKESIAGGAFLFQRLELLQSPAGDKPVVLRHARYGKLSLPPGKLVSAWQLPAYLSAEARKQVEQDVSDALNGDEKAAGQLEKALPLAHDRLRQQLSAHPDSKGAPRLRLILSLFDDAVMPPPEAVAPGGRP